VAAGALCVARDTTTPDSRDESVDDECTDASVALSSSGFRERRSSIEASSISEFQLGSDSTWWGNKATSGTSRA